MGTNPLGTNPLDSNLLGTNLLGSNHARPLETLYARNNYECDTDIPLSIVYHGDDAVGVSLVGEINWAWTPSLCVARRLLGTPATPAGRRTLRAWIARTSRTLCDLEATVAASTVSSSSASSASPPPPPPPPPSPASVEDTRYYTTFALKSTCMHLLAHKMVLEAKHGLGDLPVELECAPVDRAVVPGWTAAQEARGMMLYVPVPLFLHDPRDAAVDWECVGDDDHDRRDVTRGLDFLELRERNSTRRRRFLRLQCHHGGGDDATRVVVPNDSVLEEVHRIVAACLASSHALPPP